MVIKREELGARVSVNRGQPPPLNGPIRLGILGAGYVARMSHLPAAKMVDEIEVVALLDQQIGRARALAEQYCIPVCVDDYHQLLDLVDAVIVALPHHLHAPVAIEFLNHGIHVLCEKPMALSVEDCHRMIAVAQSKGAKLAVGHMRRFYDNMRFAKRLIETHFLGNVERFEVEESVDFASFPASQFTIQAPCGGVLWDTGPHPLDTLIWWFGDFTEIDYRDDALGGVEANCEIQISTTSGIRGTVRLSRTRLFKNVIRIHCERGVLEIPTLNPTEVYVHDTTSSAPIRAATLRHSDNNGALVQFFASQLRDFVSAILYDREPTVSGNEGVRSVAAIETCCKVRGALEQPTWMRLQSTL